MDDHLAKPFNKVELLAVIVRLVAHHSNVSMTKPPIFDARAFAQLADLMEGTEIEQHLLELEHRVEAVLERLDRQHVNANDDAILAEMVHELAGCAGTYGFVALSAAARRCGMSVTAQGGQDPMAIQELIQMARAALVALHELPSPEPVGPA
jgi:HPt (histidine-containing phosphotransfer) domain-containing protein